MQLNINTPQSTRLNFYSTIMEQWSTYNKTSACHRNPRVSLHMLNEFYKFLNKTVQLKNAPSYRQNIAIVMRELHSTQVLHLCARMNTNVYTRFFERILELMHDYASIVNNELFFSPDEVTLRFNKIRIKLRQSATLGQQKVNVEFIHRKNGYDIEDADIARGQSFEGGYFDCLCLFFNIHNRIPDYIYRVGKYGGDNRWYLRVQDTDANENVKQALDGINFVSNSKGDRLYPLEAMSEEDHWKIVLNAPALVDFDPGWSGTISGGWGASVPEADLRERIYGWFDIIQEELVSAFQNDSSRWFESALGRALIKEMKRTDSAGYAAILGESWTDELAQDWTGQSDNARFLQSNFNEGEDFDDLQQIVSQEVRSMLIDRADLYFSSEMEPTLRKCADEICATIDVVSALLSFAFQRDALETFETSIGSTNILDFLSSLKEIVDQRQMPGFDSISRSTTDVLPKVFLKNFPPEAETDNEVWNQLAGLRNDIFIVDWAVRHMTLREREVFLTQDVVPVGFSGVPIAFSMINEIFKDRFGSGVTLEEIFSGKNSDSIEALLQEELIPGLTGNLPLPPVDKDRILGWIDDVHKLEMLVNEGGKFAKTVNYDRSSVEKFIADLSSETSTFGEDLDYAEFDDPFSVVEARSETSRLQSISVAGSVIGRHSGRPLDTLVDEIGGRVRGGGRPF